MPAWCTPVPGAWLSWLKSHPPPRTITCHHIRLNTTTISSPTKQLAYIDIKPFSWETGGDYMAAENVLKQCVEVLERIMSDDAVPRNIRRSAESIKSILMDQSVSEAVKAASAISILDEISNDPNIPLHTRTLIWNVASQLETVPVG
jgi:uncharacterized protein (UPF0147 family)